MTTMTATSSFKEKLPSEIFESFRIGLIINTWNKNPSDEDVEKYIHALVDTSDSSHAHDRKQMTTKPTFHPAS